jgi:hypothetical protein
LLAFRGSGGILDPVPFSADSLAQAAARTMSQSDSGVAAAGSGPWAEARRWADWAGEVRVNLVRLVALTVFYGYHLINVYAYPDDPSVAGRYHRMITLLVLAWGCGALALHYCLTNRWTPPALKYVATACDTLLITAALMLGRDPRSTLSVLYFLVVAAAALRLSLPLVYTATAANMAAYAFFLGYVKYRLQLPDDQRLPRPQQVIFLLALAVLGLLVGQVVRQTRQLVQGSLSTRLPNPEG